MLLALESQVNTEPCANELLQSPYSALTGALRDSAVVRQLLRGSTVSFLGRFAEGVGLLVWMVLWLWSSWARVSDMGAQATETANTTQLRQRNVLRIQHSALSQGRSILLVSSTCNV
jgi:hypothetical protein